MQENQIIENEVKKEKFSYSKLEVFEQCPYKYKLIYKDKHFIHDDSIATDFGSLLHYIEEQMANRITTNFKLDKDDYAELLDLVENVNNEKEKVYGARILRDKWKDDWNTPDKFGKTYEDKLLEYKTVGIYRLRNYLIQNPDLEILAAEKEFNLEFDNVIFHGFIDRAYRDISTGQVIIEDIKTWKEPLDEDKTEFKTPLQFVIYCLAARELFNVDPDLITCQYELILKNQKQFPGTKGFIKRGIKKISTLLNDINNGVITPEPQVLCHWCQFCQHNPNQKPEAKGLCPYYSKWTPENKIRNPKEGVRYEWAGIENHEAIMKDFKAVLELEDLGNKPFIFQTPPTIVVEDKNSNRKMLIRR